MELEVFLKEKINNFSLFIKRVIGEDNKIFKDLQIYKINLQEFMKLIVNLSSYAKKNENKLFFEESTILLFLKTHDINIELKPEDFKLLNRYLDMFLNVLAF